MTYDAALVKMDPETHQLRQPGQLPPAPKRTDVVPTAQTQPPCGNTVFEQPLRIGTSPRLMPPIGKQGKSGLHSGTPGSIIGTEWNTPRIWLRREFSVPDGKPGDLRLFMHPDEDAEVYINGVSAAKGLGLHE